MNMAFKQRPLDKADCVAVFLKNIIDFDASKDPNGSKVCSDIKDAETLIYNYLDHGTYKSKNNRDIRYHGDSDREALREQILKELLTKKRLVDDNKVVLGKGGLLPRSELLFEKKLYLVTGLPASGKSRIAEKIADSVGAYLIDNDYAKRKFPEFHSTANYGPTVVHEESAVLCEGPIDDESYKGINAIDYALKEKANVVLPKICPTAKKIKSIFELFGRHGYSCYLVHVQLEREKAVGRAFKRYLTTNRYVPLSLIYDAYANDPTLAFFETRDLPSVKGYVRFYTGEASGKTAIRDRRGINGVTNWI